MPLLEIWNQEPWLRFGVAISLALILAVIIRRTDWGLCCRAHEGTIAFVQAHCLQSLPRLRAALAQPSLSRSMADSALFYRHAGS